MSTFEISADPTPLASTRLVLGTFAVALATFMNVLDALIVKVEIPTISRSRDVSLDKGTCAITLFAAANAVSIPLTGWLTQRIGHVKLFVLAIVGPRAVPILGGEGDHEKLQLVRDLLHQCTGRVERASTVGRRAADHVRQEQEA